jgi:DNA-binding NarL/FixJ family response regulator
VIHNVYLTNVFKINDMLMFVEETMRIDTVNFAVYLFNTMVSVIIADDHAVVRTGLSLIFQVSAVISAEGEADNGDDLLNILKEKQFDVAIVDVNMPGKNSLELIAELRELYPEMKLVVFSMNTDEQLATRMFKNGVQAYINKEENPEELIRAVVNAAQGKRYLTQRQKYYFANQFIIGQDEVADYENLTDREYQIMCLLVSGKSKSEIAEKLAISKNTLSNHRNNLLKKLNLSNNVQLTKYAMRHKLTH